MRVLRAVRLLKKSKSLAPIVNALLASIMPVLNAFTLLGLVSAIYASMAVGLFGTQSPVLFGKLSSSIFTMFQVSCLPSCVVSGKALFVLVKEASLCPCDYASILNTARVMKHAPYVTDMHGRRLGERRSP